MRAAPHGVMAGDAGEVAENAWGEAALTHPSREARASSALVAVLVAHLLEGIPSPEALEASLALVESRDRPGKRVREVLRPLEGYQHDPGGWTVYTTRFALLCLLGPRISVPASRA
jgi:ADP-ribosylglycohydrolase